MALTVETGAGLSGADAYISAADAATYLAGVGADSAWTAASTASKEAAIRRATQYLDTQYRWRGVQLTGTQALEWPRVIDVDGRSYTWPVTAIKNACAELAVRALSGALHADEGQTIKSEQVGPIRTEYESGLQGGQTRFVAVDRMVAKFTTGGGRSALTIERVQ